MATKIRSSAQLNIDTDVDVQSHKLTNVTDGVADSDGATVGQVKALVNGLDWKPSVRVATTANITLSGTQTIDGVAVVAGDRVLVKNQTTGANNGIYVVASGAWTRALDADANAEVTANMACFVAEGTTLADTQWSLTTNDAIVLGTTSLTFAQIGAGTTYTPADTSITISGSTVKQTPGTNGQINQTVAGIVTPVTVSGDATMASGGALTIAMSTLLTNHFSARSTPSGTINGSNVTFTLANTPISGTEHVYLNGQLLTTTTDYTISGATITMVTAPATGDILRVTYFF